MEEKYMVTAFAQAKKAFQLDEVPIGAVIVKDGKIISRAYNTRNKTQKAIVHILYRENSGLTDKISW